MTQFFKIFISEHHLYSGVCNKIVDVCHEKTVQLNLQVPLYDWLHAPPRCIVHEEYFGNLLNGPNCQKVMEDKNLRAMAAYLPKELEKYVVALWALKALKHEVFSTRKLNRSVVSTATGFQTFWESKIDNFVVAFEALGIPEFPKYHMIKCHVKEFIAISKDSLGYYSEVCDYLLKKYI